MSQSIAAAYLAEIDSPATGPQHLPGIVQCARHACRLKWITMEELNEITKRAEEKQAVPVSEPSRQRKLF